MAAGEMAPLLRTCCHIRWLTIACNSSSRGPDTLYEHLHLHAYNPHINKKKKIKNRKFVIMNFMTFNCVSLCVFVCICVRVHGRSRGWLSVVNSLDNVGSSDQTQVISLGGFTRSAISASTSFCLPRTSVEDPCPPLPPHTLFLLYQSPH